MFNKQFDRSLWLILKTDKNNRGKIIEFIKSIPNELYELIYIKLDEFRQYENGNIDIFENDDVFCLYGNVLTEDNCKYSFIIDMVMNSISISKSIFYGEEFSKVFELTLDAETTYNNTVIFHNQRLGSFKDSYGYVRYEMSSTILGMMVVCSNNRLKKYKRVNINEISDNISIENLSDWRGIARVRRIK